MCDFAVIGSSRKTHGQYHALKTRRIRIRCVFKACTGHAFKCLGWPCPNRFIFYLSGHQPLHFVSLHPETLDVATRVLGNKWVQSTELDIVITNGSFFNLYALALELALHILLHSTDESQQGQNSCSLLQPCFIGSCHDLPCSLLSQRIFWLIRSLVDSTLEAFIVCGPSQFLASQKLTRHGEKQNLEPTSIPGFLSFA